MDKIADSNIMVHIIGTTAILSMFFMVGTYYDGYFNTLHNEAYKAQLGQVGEYVASNIIDLITLSQLTENDLFLVKDIDPPPFIGEKLYNISIVTMIPSYGDTEVIRVITQIDALNIYSVSDLPWSSNSTIKIYTGQGITPPNEIKLKTYLSSDAAIGEAVQTKGCASMIVWCSKDSGFITIGLGVMDTGKEA